MKQKFLSYIMLFVFVFSLVFTTPAYADEVTPETPVATEVSVQPEVVEAFVTEMPQFAPIVTEEQPTSDPVADDPIVEPTLTEEPVAQATDTP